MVIEIRSRANRPHYDDTQVDQRGRLSNPQSWSAISGPAIFPDPSSRKTSVVRQQHTNNLSETTIPEAPHGRARAFPKLTIKGGSTGSLVPRKPSSSTILASNKLREDEDRLGVMRMQQLIDCIDDINVGEHPPPRPPKARDYYDLAGNIATGSSASAMLRKSRTSSDLVLGSYQGSSPSVTSFSNIRVQFRKYSESEMTRSNSQLALNQPTFHPTTLSATAIQPKTAESNRNHDHGAKFLDLYARLQRVTRLPKKKAKPVPKLRRTSKSGSLIDLCKRAVTGKSKSTPVSPQTTRHTTTSPSSATVPCGQRRVSMSSEELGSLSGSTSGTSTPASSTHNSPTDPRKDSELAIFDGEAHHFENLDISTLLRAHSEVFADIDWGESLGDGGYLNVAVLGGRNTGKTALYNRLIHGMFDTSYEPTIAETTKHTFVVGGHKCSVQILDTSMDEWTSDRTVQFRPKAMSPGMYRASNRSSATHLTLATRNSSSSLINLGTTTNTNRESKSVPSSIDPLWWAHGYILTFSTDDKRSFKRVVALKEELLDRRRRFPELSTSQPPIIIVGTKLDVYEKPGRGFQLADNLPKWLSQVETLVTEKWGLQFKLVTCTGHQSNTVFYDLGKEMRDYYIPLLLREGFSYNPYYAPHEPKEHSVSSAPGRMVTVAGR